MLGEGRGREDLLAILVQTVTLTEEENKMKAFFSTLWSQGTYLNVHVWERKKYKHTAYNTSFWVLRQAIWGHVETERKRETQFPIVIRRVLCVCVLRWSDKEVTVLHCSGR